MEMLTEKDRFENGGLSRECAASLAVASMQRLFDLLKESEDGKTEE